MSFRKGSKINKWVLEERLGRGGNGEVWTCNDNEGNKMAIKLLKRNRRNSKSWKRFENEIKLLSTIQDIQGILPIVDYSISVEGKRSIPFYVMPIAEACESILDNQPIETKINAMLQISTTLKELHRRNICHRDIKPDNILYQNNHFVLADFGLVDFPNKEDISEQDENIGPKWTIAPEMRRNSSESDGKKADIYSLGKTLWILLTKNSKGFDGQYSTNSIIELRRFNANSFIVTLDRLLVNSTDHDPNRRPTIEEFITVLEEWQLLADNFHERMRREWQELQIKLFPHTVPEQAIWTSIEDIVRVLKFTCSTEYINHVFFPISGGLDLIDVRLSREADCIELDFNVLEIVKPRRLIFESFGQDAEWNYFRLELSELTPTIFPEQFEHSEKRVNESYEDVTELAPASYFPYSALSSDRKDYLINSYGRRIRRRFKGNFVIFGKRSSYNLISSTYDGRHDRLNAQEFRDLIASVVRKSPKLYNETKSALISEEPKQSSKKYFLEEQSVFRCGKCGSFLDGEGNKLDEHEQQYSLALVNRFGEKILSRLMCKSCRRIQD